MTIEPIAATPADARAAERKVAGPIDPSQRQLQCAPRAHESAQPEQAALRACASARACALTLAVSCRAASASAL